MTAPNHALTGALIGLSISNPLMAMPLAFLSHFVCDAIPHYDPPVQNKASLFRSKRFVYEFLVAGIVLCGGLVIVLAVTRPAHWVNAALCAFLATSPDLFWIPRYLHARRTGHDKPIRNPFLRFHSSIQWKTGPEFIWVEAVWFVACSALVISRL